MNPDRDSAEWWQRVARGSLDVQACAACGTRRFPPRMYCNRCRSRDWRWRPTGGTGRIASWIVSHQWSEDPLTVVMVRLSGAEDCVLFGNWCGSREPYADEPVEAVFTEEGLVHWRPAAP